MYSETELARLSYRDLQVLAARHRVPGNIKKHAMIKIILASRKGDDTEVTRLLNELQQTRKKKVKKIKKERKVTIKPRSLCHTNYQKNRYYAHQKQTSYHCASNLQLASEEEILNNDNERISNLNYESVHEYLVRVQRDYHFNINNNNERTGTPSIVDLRMNEQKTIVHQGIPLDLHRTNILLSSDRNHQNNQEQITYHNFFDANDTSQTPLLLKQMLQAPVGTDLNDIAGPDGIYHVNSKSDYVMNNFVDDSDTLSADSETNINDDMDNTNKKYYCILNADRNSFINIDQNIVDDQGVEEFESNNQNLSNDNDHYQLIYQSPDVQQNCQKWSHENSATVNNNMTETVPDNAEIFKTIYYNDQSQSQERINNTQTNQVQYYALNNIATITNDSDKNHDNPIESSNSSSQLIMYNRQSDNNNNSAIVDNNMENNHRYTYYNHQARNDDTNDYYSQSSNVHDSGIFNDLYPNAESVTSQLNSNNIDNMTGLNNSNIFNNERWYNNGYYYNHHDSYVQNCQMGLNNINHHNQVEKFIPNQQNNIYQELYNMDMNQSTNNDLDIYFPRWKQSTATSNADVNLENLLNIRKCDESDETKNNETSSVFCYSAPIVSPKQLISHANICTQEMRFLAETNNNLLMKTNSNQVYNDTAQGLKMSNFINDLYLHSPNQSEMNNTEYSSLNEKNIRDNNLIGINSNDLMPDVWAINYSSINCERQTKLIE